MKITIEVPAFHAAFDQTPIHRFLKDVGDKTKQIMVQQAAAPKSGRVYQLRGGGTYTASAPGEYPANKLGHLSSSYDVAVEGHTVTIGTDVPIYPAYLRTGTVKMAPRKFLKEALHTALEMEHITAPFAVWRKG